MFRVGVESSRPQERAKMRFVDVREDHAEDRPKSRGLTGCHCPWGEPLKGHKDSAGKSHWVNKISWHLTVHPSIFYQCRDLNRLHIAAPRGHVSTGSSEGWTHINVQARSNKAGENGSAQCIMGRSLAASANECVCVCVLMFLHSLFTTPVWNQESVGGELSSNMLCIIIIIIIIYNFYTLLVCLLFI